MGLEACWKCWKKWPGVTTNWPEGSHRNAENDCVCLHRQEEETCRCVLFLLSFHLCSETERVLHSFAQSKRSSLPEGPCCLKGSWWVWAETPPFCFSSLPVLSFNVFCFFSHYSIVLHTNRTSAHAGEKSFWRLRKAHSKQISLRTIKTLPYLPFFSLSTGVWRNYSILLQRGAGEPDECLILGCWALFCL